MTDANQPLSEGELQRRYRAQISADGAGTHPSEDDWVRFSCDEVDDDERARLADHVVTCAACADVFRALAEVRAGASAFDPDAPVPVDTTDGPVLTRVPMAAITSSTRWYGLAAAAAIVLAVGVTAWWRQAAPAPVEPTTAPAVARDGSPPSVTPSAPAIPAWATLPVAPAVSLPAALTLVVRGAPSDREGFMTAFGAAIAPYRQGRYAEAATALEDVAATYPQVVETWFYLGVSRLLSDRAADAVDPLRRARASEVVGDEARWLEAVALARAGRLDDAAPVLRALCETSGPMRGRACEAAAATR